MNIWLMALSDSINAMVLTVVMVIVILCVGKLIGDYYVKRNKKNDP